MKFRFPIVIIDEDFRSENTSGLGIRALADAIEGEGYEVPTNQRWCINSVSLDLELND